MLSNVGVFTYHTACDITEKALRSLFSQNFPKLKHLQYKAQRWSWHVPTRIVKLKTFLEKEKHKNLKHFGCSARELWENRGVLRETNIQLDTLSIDFHRWDLPKRCAGFALFLNKLHERGFYKTLHLSFDNDSSVGSKCFNKSSAIEKVYLEGEKPIVDLSNLTGLKELHAYGLKDNNYAESASTSLISLERLVIQHACNEEYWPFVCNSKRLKFITVCQVNNDDEDVDVFALNEERKSSGGSRIYLRLPESVYLRAKWKLNNLNLSYVGIKRFVMQDPM